MQHVLNTGTKLQNLGYDFLQNQTPIPFPANNPSGHLLVFCARVVEFFLKWDQLSNLPYMFYSEPNYRKLSFSLPTSSFLHFPRYQSNLTSFVCLFLSIPLIFTSIYVVFTPLFLCQRCSSLFSKSMFHTVL